MLSQPFFMADAPATPSRERAMATGGVMADSIPQ